MDPLPNLIGLKLDSDYFYRIQIGIFFIEFASDNFASDQIKFALNSDHIAIAISAHCGFEYLYKSSCEDTETRNCEDTETRKGMLSYFGFSLIHEEITYQNGKHKQLLKGSKKSEEQKNSNTETKGRHEGDTSQGISRDHRIRIEEENIL